MCHSVKQHLSVLAILGGIVLVGFVTNYGRNTIGTTVSLMRERHHIPDTFEYRVAKRLESRLNKDASYAFIPPIDKLADAVTMRHALLKGNVHVTFEAEDSIDLTEWTARTAENPHWITASFSLTEASFRIDPEHVQSSLEQDQPLDVPPPMHAVLRSVEWSGDENAVSRAEIDGIAQSGYIPDYREYGEQIAAALEREEQTLRIHIPRSHGRIINMTDDELGKLVLWASGKSDYKGSTYGRSFNVQKALNEHVTNTVVSAGEQFSFNATLDGPVSLGNGWREAKVIFNGGDLEYAPGGGICQASTTVFRSAVNAGFPVIERRAHSLYVKYYKKHGIGIDATIYPGSQDLVFENDSKHPLIIQAYNDGTEAIVNIYGTPDGRIVELYGPYFAANAPEDFTYNERKLSRREIAWLQRVVYPSGEVRDHTIVSRYRELPLYAYSEFLAKHSAAQ